ncbi:MAG: DOMON domain-containing protein [Spirochaetes bacterium]|nr:DOMON domain-containing protein [Spirochaetota bacterium]
MKKMRLFALAVVLLAIAALYPAAAQTPAPVADGVLNANEYTIAFEKQTMKLGFTLSADRSVVYVAIQAPSTGWVSIGLGSTRMNGTYMVLGYDAAGKTAISEETGTTNGHKPNPAGILKTKAVKEANGQTTLEFSVPAVKFLKGDAMDMIIAYSNKDDLVSFHGKFTGLTVQFKK